MCQISHPGRLVPAILLQSLLSLYFIHRVRRLNLLLCVICIYYIRLWYRTSLLPGNVTVLPVIYQISHPGRLVTAILLRSLLYLYFLQSLRRLNLLLCVISIYYMILIVETDCIVLYVYDAEYRNDIDARARMSSKYLLTQALVGPRTRFWVSGLGFGWNCRETVERIRRKTGGQFQTPWPVWVRAISAELSRPRPPGSYRRNTPSKLALNSLM